MANYYNNGQHHDFEGQDDYEQQFGDGLPEYNDPAWAVLREMEEAAEAETRRQVAQWLSAPTAPLLQVPPPRAELHLPLQAPPEAWPTGALLAWPAAPAVLPAGAWPASPAASPAFQAEYGVRLRLRKKQAPPPMYSVPQPSSDAGERAVAAEGWAEVVALSEDAQRQHVHYTHVRTKKAGDKQPGHFTRQGFWEHLVRVYAEVYPEPANPTSSVLLFGAVAKEHHAASADDALRDEHHHAPTFCSKRHFWHRVAKVSHDKYKVKLHAAAHEGYSTMYSYIVMPTAKKPLPELDAEVYLSPAHPRGLTLRRLLEAGSVRQRAVAGRRVKAKATEEQGPPAKRIRDGDMYSLVAVSGVKTALEMQGLAHARAAAGDSALAEFCTSRGVQKLQELIDAAVAVIEAPAAIALKAATRMDLLRRAAQHCPCTCGGVWAAGATRVLLNNGEDVQVFCQDVCRAFEMGARRGTNLAILGVPGCGKSMLFESMDLIFKVMGKPEHGSSFALAGALDSHLLLWQDYIHSDSTVQFEDILSLVVGERMDIRLPRSIGKSFRNTSPLFFTSQSALQVKRACPVTTAQLNEAMQERFTVRRWVMPLPLAERVLDFPKCGRCSANFYLKPAV